MYLSPQQMIALKYKKISPKHNVYKSDVFALGIVILEMCFL